MQEQEYSLVTVETFIPTRHENSGSKIRVRPTHDQGDFLKSMRVECSRHLRKEYPVGTKFRIKAKISIADSGTKFIYSNHAWSYEVLK